MKFKDNEYDYNVIDITQKGEDLICTFFPKRGLGLKKQTLTIRDFRQTTAREVLSACPDMGRHFEDGILKTYKSLGVHLGFMRNYL